ncbi:HalOD1 output domain-containing protein [Natronorubrum texcoconense]|nr:HalOD1 output domain-containing protein [Natronorubrum texcoconense]
MTEWIDPPDDDVVARLELDTTQEAPEIRLVEIVADLESVPETELDPIYNSIDDVVDSLLSSPPSSTANAELEFTYEGYRIHVKQGGTAVFRDATV